MYNNDYNYYTTSGSGGTPPVSGEGRSVYYRGGQMYTHPYGSALGGTPPEPPREERKAAPKNKYGPKWVAAALALCLVSGAAGGGTTYWLLKDNLSVEAAASQDTPASATTIPMVTSTVEGTDITAVVAKASPSVVEITTQIQGQDFFMGRYDTEQAGSGVIISEDGYIVTNNHVVNGGSSVMIRTQDGTEYSAHLVGTDAKTDLAILKVEATGLQPVTFADSDNVQVGQVAVAIGNPLGTLGGTVTNGIISAKDRELTIENEAMTLLQTSAAVNPGNSGGGLFDAEGNLVGVVNAKSAGTDIEGLGFAIPSNMVKAVADELISNGYVSGRPQLGISVLEVTDPASAMRYRLSEPGVYVAAVNTENGLQAGDLIRRVDGVEISALADITDVLAEHQVGDVLNVTIQREGAELELQVTLTEQIPESIRQRVADSEKL